MADSAQKEDQGRCTLNRREFLLYGGTAAVAVSTISLSLFSGSARARVVGYPRQWIARLSQLTDHQLLNFRYPNEQAQSFLVKMGGVQAGGGLGLEHDVVAFSYICTHQGGSLKGGYKAVGEHRVMGQCPLHLSTYDLTRHGIIVSGQAYQSLPQVVLELEGDDIYASGVMGLLHGYHDNLPSRGKP
ncbi:MAG: arsenate reductase (azurin) small subunit [Candidatus Polarisedimenticolaceae bacterium]|nr:arsenate reductase (azurin) small subunit [Candidatus Polarisedimenticolaceae bacterium]